MGWFSICHRFDTSRGPVVSHIFQLARRGYNELNWKVHQLDPVYHANLITRLRPLSSILLDKKKQRTEPIRPQNVGDVRMWLDKILNQPGVVFSQSSTLISYTPGYNNAFTS